jgi:ATPase subunit of ABC transporter with duplicated ATPase domains
VPRRFGVLAARHIDKSYGDVVVIDDFSLTLRPGERVGLVGPNGIGKSTLLRMLAGVEQPDRGEVRREPRDLALAYVPQVLALGGSSPGQAARAALESVAELHADVLVLDEPTNSLDEDGLRFLERLVTAHRGALLVASHDRAFLELMDQIVEFEAETRRIGTYAGGWSAFARERAASRGRDAAAYAAYRSQLARVEEHAARMQRWQQRGYGQGRKKKKTRDVAKTIEQRRARLGEVEKPWSAWRLQMSFEQDRRGGDRVVALRGASIEREGFALGPLELEVHAGDRLAVTGPNGSGKSTLLAAVLGEQPLVAGTREVGPSTVFATLPQQDAGFAGEARLIDASRGESGLSEQDARSLLAKFALEAEDVRRPCNSLSPGERTRAGLALIVARQANTLVLDEPTNNLDIEAIEQLEAALETFAGTILLVSHDRRFLEGFAATRTVRLDGGRLTER